MVDKILNFLFWTAVVVVACGVVVGIFFLQTYRWGSCS
jgi:hypothetical protein